jgi:hypothetical protein
MKTKPAKKPTTNKSPAKKLPTKKVEKPVESKTLVLPAACNKCKSTKFTPVPGSKTRVVETVGYVLGFRYIKLKRTRSQCECGQITDIRTYYES